MKSMIKSFTSFNRTERLGIAALLSVGAILVIVKATMHYWVNPDPIKAELKPDSQSVQGVADVTRAEIGSKINVNTADSMDLIAIKGIGKVLSHRILKKRREIGKYDSWEQVFEVYHFSEKTKETLRNNLVIE